jgi:hypothetical protein
MLVTSNVGRALPDVVAMGLPVLPWEWAFAGWITVERCSFESRSVSGAKAAARDVLLQFKLYQLFCNIVGGVVSPLLANIYWHRFDAWFVEQYTCPPGTSKEAWRKERVKGGAKAAAQMFRYADDWIILVRGTKSQARDRKRALQAVSP